MGTCTILMYQQTTISLFEWKQNIGADPEALNTKHIAPQGRLKLYGGNTTFEKSGFFTTIGPFGFGFGVKATKGVKPLKAGLVNLTGKPGRTLLLLAGKPGRTLLLLAGKPGLIGLTGISVTGRRVFAFALTGRPGMSLELFVGPELTPSAGLLRFAKTGVAKPANCLDC
jgi:hypothetical protein